MNTCKSETREEFIAQLRRAREARNEEEAQAIRDNLPALDDAADVIAEFVQHEHKHSPAA